MLNIKVPADGQSVSFSEGVVWVSPARDVAFSFPGWVSKVLRYASEVRTDPEVASFWDKHGETDGNQILSDAATVLASFTTQALDVNELAKVSDVPRERLNFLFKPINGLPLDVRQLLSHSMFQVVLSAFVHGSWEARMSHDIKFDFDYTRSVAPRPSAVVRFFKRCLHYFYPYAVKTT
jgi:hypothetical protein